ncbi:MAG: immunoglobulin domain-containing protein [Verrucomicrobiota bacterium]
MNTNIQNLLGSFLSIAMTLTAVLSGPAAHADSTPPAAGIVSWWPGEDNAGDSRALSPNEISASDLAGSAGKWGNSSVSSTAVPAIFGLAPASAATGAPILIAGTNFSATAASNLVYFGAVQANVAAATPTSLTATVPAGAIFASITVTVGGLTAYSGQFFEPTFSGSNATITASSFAPSFDLNTATGPGSTIIADVDGDGKPDIVIACGGGAVLSIYRNISASGTPLGVASFAPPVNLTFPANGTSGDPYRVRAVDLDGDGRLDLIAAEVGGNRVSVFHNISTPGSVAFEPAFALMVGSDCRSVAGADLDGDGRPDIVALNYGDKTISLLRNIGANPGTLNPSSFAVPVVLAAPGGPYEAAIADLNGDGKPDLAVAESDSGTVTIFQNAGGVLSSNTFPSSFDLPCGIATAAIVAVDLDGDGRIDLAAGSVQSETFSVFQNVSTGGLLSSNSFGPRVDFATGCWTHTLAIADFNGDGKPDIAVVGELPSTMSVFENVSTPGTFTTASLAPPVNFSTGWNAWGVAAGDLVGDGRPDIVFCNDYDATIQIYQNIVPSGTPSVAPPVITGIIPNLAAPGSNVAISGNNFSANAASNIVFFGSVRAVVSSASPTRLVATVPTGAVFAPVTVSVGGLTAYSGPAFEPTFAGSSSNITVSSFAPAFILPAGAEPGATVVGDLDGDGKPDLVICNDQDGTISIYRNLGTGSTLSGASFAAPVILPLAGALGRVTLADLDGDGRLDILATDAENNQVSVFQNFCVPGVLSANSFGTRVDCPVGQQPYGLAVRDLNGDGYPDIVTANSGDGTISVLQNTGSPGRLITSNSFAAHVDFTVGSAPQGVALGDLDGDGRPDIAVANVGAGSLSIFQNLGGAGNITSNSFGPPIDLVTAGGGEDIAIADVDGDGKPDLLVTGYLPQVLSVFQNLSTPGTITANSFGPRIDFPTGGRAHRVAVGDLNGDGQPDVTISTELPSQLLIFQNTSTPGVLSSSSLAAPVALSAGWNPNGTTLADLAGDGRPDIIFCNDYDGNVWIYQNEIPFSTPIVAPGISVQPTSVAATVNSTAVFAVAASGTPPLNYQWEFDGTNLAGATGPTLTLTNVQPAQAGDYSVLLWNSAGSVLSSNAVLTVVVAEPPTILGQSPGEVVAVGGAATFSVMAGGSPPLSYFWSQDGILIPDATNASYSLFNAQLSDSGSSFSCLVTNAYGSAASTNVYLKVIETVANGLCSGAIVITSASYTNAQSTLKADAPGNPAPDCVFGFGHGVWYEISSPVAGLLEVDTFGSDYDTGLGLYAGSCDVMTEVACNDDAAGGVTSQIIAPTTAGTTYYILAGGYDSDAGNLVLHVNYQTPPEFAVEPADLSVAVGSNAVFSPTLTGTLPIGFQWYFDSLPLVDGGRISGSTSSTLTIANVMTNDGGSYQLVASNSLGVTTSSVAMLTPVILPPTFVQLPANQSVGQGSNAIFSAVAGGTPPFSYQWSFNGSPLADDGVHFAGSLTSSLSISNLTAADAGSYGLTVTNLSGSTNAAATLTVLTPPVVTVQPVGRSVPPGLPTIFGAFVTGIPTPNYQWQLNGTNIPGAVGLIYTNAGIGTNDLGFYTLVASNLMGVAVSTSAQLTFGPVAAWGNNANNACLPPPGLSEVVAVAGDQGAGFAVRLDGSVAAWGGGAGTNVSPAATNVVAIAASESTTDYALRSDGTVVAWNGFVALPGSLVSTGSNIVAIAAGIDYGVGLRAEGSLVAWGDVPENWLPAGLSHVTAIAMGYEQGLALRNDGTVVAWGGGAGTNVPAGLANVTAIAAGLGQSLALKSNGTVVAWGSGNGTNVPAGLTNVVAIYAGGQPQEQVIGFLPPGQSLSLALRADGTVVAWGDNFYGETNVPAALSQLLVVGGAAAPDRGYALVNDGSPQILQPPVGLTAYTGRSVTLQARAAGAAPLSFQWLLNGTNIAGATNSSLVFPDIQAANAGKYQLLVSNSINTALSLPAPVNVLSNRTLTFLSQASASATNVYQGGKLTLYGGAVLGSGPLAYQWYFSPTNVPVFEPVFLQNYHAIPGATNDTLTFDPALAVQSGIYYVAVSNQFGGLSSTPISVRIMFEKAWGYGAVDAPFVLTNATAVAVGNNGAQSTLADYLALSSAGRISSWSTEFPEFGQTNFASLSNSIVTAIAAGYEDTLALKSDGTVLALGGSTQVLPAQGSSLTNVPASVYGITAIACGDYHDLALRYDGTVIGWGQSIYGQTTSTNANNVVAIAAGGDDSIALRADGSVTTWGEYGSREFEVPSNATNMVAVAAGGSHFLALNANGTVIGWGLNGAGQTAIPLSWTNIVAISAGATHSTALRNDGTVLVVGGSFDGIFSNYVPVNLTNVIAIASSGDRDLGLFGTRAPAFTVHPWDRTIANTTTSVWFAAKCAGVQPMHYQWKFNGVNVPGATNDLLTVNATVTNNIYQQRVTLPLQSGAYQLVASNAYGVVASHYAQLQVVIPLGVALNATNLSWTTSGDAQWFGETNVTHDGVSAAQSGDIGPFQDTILQTTVITNGSGNFSFWWKVSSEPDFDFLEFRINGLVQTNISGEVDWQHVSFPANAGTSVLTWRYYQDSLYGSGLDAGWLDQFAFVPNPVIIRQPFSVTNYVGAEVEFSVEANSGLPPQSYQDLGYQWQKNGVNLTNSAGHIAGANLAFLNLLNLQEADAATYSVVITNTAGGFVTSQPATLTVLERTPTITGQASSLANYAGTTATFVVTATGSAPLSYEWYQNGVNLGIGGVVSGGIVLTITNVQDANAGSYTVVVSNGQGDATSLPAVLTVVDGPPVITAQPASSTVIPGQTATFAPAAAGTAPIGYLWQFNGTNLAGATNLVLTIANAQGTNAGPYQVVATNTYGSVTSSIAALTVLHSWIVAWGDDTWGQTNVPAGLPDVTAISAGWRHSLALRNDTTVDAWGYNGECTVGVPPGLTNVAAISAGGGWGLALKQDGAVVALECAGVDPSATFNVSGLSNITAVAAGWYHWLALKTDGSLVTWSDSADSYTPTNIPPGLSNVKAIAAGLEYSLALKPDGTVVGWGWNAYGQTNVPSGLSNVTAIAASSVSSHSLALKADGTVVAWGADWDGQADVPAGLSNVVAIAAGANHSLALRSDGTVVGWGATGTSNYGQAIVPAGLGNVVAISAGDTHSLALVNDGSPFITKQPAGQIVSANSTVQLRVAALGAPTLSYQWQKGGVNLTDGGNVSGSTSATLTLGNVQSADVARYTVVITNAVGGVVSLPATLVIAGPPVILVQPASQTVNYGANVQFGVVAVGSPAPAYTWWWNGTNQVGGNSPTLTLAGAARAQDGLYAVTVTNAAGGVRSSNVVLEVLVPQLLGAPMLLPNGTLQLTSSDLGGGTLLPSELPSFEVQVSSNLVNWAPLPNVLSITNGLLQLQDGTWTNYPARFYRIIEH